MARDLRLDLVYALRMIVKTPVASAIAVLSLAVGIAANATIFSVVSSWLLRPLPYPDADRLVMVYGNDLKDPDDYSAAPVSDFFDWRQRATSFDAWLAQDYGPAVLTGGEEPQEVTLARVSPDFFRLLGVQPLRGRTFRPDEGGAEDPPAAVLGESLWRRRFGGDPALLGRTLILEGQPTTVVGVVPESFDFLLGAVELWVPSDFEAARSDPEEHAVVTARLAPGVSVAQAQAEMSAIARQLADLHPETHRNRGVFLQTVRDEFPGRSDTALVEVLMTVVFLVLLVACANIGGLLLARTEARRRELALRLALGARRRRLFRQLLTESLALAFLGGSLGTVLAVGGIDLVTRALPDLVPAFFLPHFDGTVFLFAVAASILAGLAFGMGPALQALGGGLRDSLVDGGRGGTPSRRRKGLRSVFVVAQFALALAVLVGAAVLTDLLHTRLDVDPGFDARQVLTVGISLPAYRYGDDGSRATFGEGLLRELAEVPGVQEAALASVLPRTRRLEFTGVTADGRPAEPGEAPTTSWLSVSPEYLDTLRIALVGGRFFTSADRAGSPPVVVVDRRLVENLFAGEEPVGHRITIDGASREIVGVVADVAQNRLAGLEPRYSTVYFPFSQRPVSRLRVALRAEGDLHRLGGPVREAVRAVDPAQPIAEVQTLEERVAFQLAGPRVVSQILLVVGLLALGLAAIGIYGLMAHKVVQQTPEIGIRMALGATRGRVLSAVVRQGLWLGGLGVAVGIPAALAVTRGIQAIFAGGGELASQQQVVAPGPVVAVAGILVGAGVLACYLPARRATRIDPARALHQG